MNKKGDLELQYIFLVAIGVIVVFVVVAIITKLGYNVPSLFCKVTGTCDTNKIVPGNQIVNLTQADCDTVKKEIIKHAELCYTKISMEQQGNIFLCYVLYLPGNCAGAFSALDLEQGLLMRNINASVVLNPDSDKAAISYSRLTHKVEVG